MRQQDGDERKREREPGGPGAQKPGIAGVTAREKRQGTGIRNPAREDSTGQYAFGLDLILVGLRELAAAAPR